MSKIIGIDLGTTNSVVAIMEGSEVKVITNPTGARTTPSVVAFKDDGERVVGQPAKNQAVTNPENTVYSIKRFMGRRPAEVKSEEKLVPYKVVAKGDAELVRVRIRDKEYAPPEISAMILSYMKQYAEDYLGEKVTEAVITVPAYFNDAQRTATKEAGEIAGLKVRRILNEPTAAALAYGLDKKDDEKILIYDLGGGTFDVSVLEVSKGLLEVKSTNGDTHLGGDDFDQALVDWISDEFKKGDGKGLDLRKDKLALQRLREAAEKCKCELSSALTATVNLPFIAQVDGQPKHLQVEVTRKKFELLCGHLIEKTRKPVEQALKDAGLPVEKIDQVVLVGGSTRIPAVQQLVREMFGKEPNRSVNPDEVVAVGAAVQAEVLAKGDRGEKMDMLLLDVTPLTLGIETLGGVMTPMIPRNTTIPISKKEIFSTAQDDQPAVDVKVYQGERKMADKNRLLGVFRLDEIPPARKGVPKIEVAFDIDANGIISVTAKNLGTGKEQRITCQAGSGLSKADIERMKIEAEQNAAEDERRHALAESLNKADAAIYAAESFAKSNPEQLIDDETFMRALADLKVARKDASDAARIDALVEALGKAMHAASDRLYQRQHVAHSAGPDAQGGSAAEDSDDDSDDEDSDDEDSDEDDDGDEDSDDEGDEDSDDEGDEDGEGSDEDDILDSAPKS